MRNEKISIITVVYNAVDKIEKSMQSVVRQTWPNVEYIVVDGASTDGTIDVIERYKDKIAYFISEKDEGLYDALNKGIRAATGEWIGIMNAGDVFVNDKVLENVFGEKDYSGVDVVFGDATEVDYDVTPPRRMVLRGTKNMADIGAFPAYRHGASFVRRETHLRYLFDLSKKPLLGYALDYYQIHSMFAGGCRFVNCGEMIIEYEKAGVSANPKKSRYYNYLITHKLRVGLGGKLGFGLSECRRSVKMKTRGVLMRIHEFACYVSIISCHFSRRRVCGKFFAECLA